MLLHNSVSCLSLVLCMSLASSFCALRLDGNSLLVEKTGRWHLLFFKLNIDWLRNAGKRRVAILTALARFAYHEFSLFCHIHAFDVASLEVTTFMLVWCCQAVGQIC